MISMTRLSNRLVTEQLVTTLRHPQLDKNYFYEYEALLQEGVRGVPLFKESFIYRQYCEKSQTDELKEYVDNLIDNSPANAIPLLQFNRSALRVQWFKHYYPSSLNIYIVRNPRDQWQSYCQCFRQHSPFFVLESLIVVGVNANTDYFKPLAKLISLPSFGDETAEALSGLYASMLPSYTIAELYLLFYYLWLKSLIENILHADIIVDINVLSRDDACRARLAGNILSFSGVHLNFNDARIVEYDSFVIDRSEMDEIERKIDLVVIQALNQGELHKLGSRMGDLDLPDYGFLPKGIRGAI
jgi:hypothetical protein